jgi:myosin heavy subunit
MAILHNTTSGLTAAQASEKLSSNSLQKEAFTIETAYEKIDLTQNDYGVMREALSKIEKNQLLALKKDGWNAPIRDTSGKNGPPLEYDHIVYSFDARETAFYRDPANADQLESVRNIVAESLRNGENSGIHALVSYEVHDDTANMHFHFLRHRHAVDVERKMISASDSLDSDSRRADLTKAIREKMANAGLEYGVIEDWKTARTAGKTAEQVIRASENVEKEILAAGGEKVESVLAKVVSQSIVPEIAILERGLQSAQKEAQRVAEQAQQAASRVAEIQHALSAVARMQELADEKAAIEAQAQTLAASLEQAQAERESLAAELTQASDHVSDLTSKVIKIDEQLETAYAEIDNATARAVEAETRETETIAAIANLEEQSRVELLQAQEQIEKTEKQAQSMIAEAIEKMQAQATAQIDQAVIAVRAESTIVITELREQLAKADHARELIEVKAQVTEATLREQIADLKAERERLQNAQHVEINHEQQAQSQQAKAPDIDIATKKKTPAAEYYAAIKQKDIDLKTRSEFALAASPLSKKYDKASAINAVDVDVKRASVIESDRFITIVKQDDKTIAIDTRIYEKALAQQSKQKQEQLQNDIERQQHDVESKIEQRDDDEDELE